ncbi:MAG: Phosphoglycolate phosphatase [Syntrophorhabdus sp. PtaB.Bin184]|jgi:phosphoglycolate phosphatase|nr:MAG: Phosphoglycolate phosphatase [Syntrophorhabdus sp. PtaB.Bin184]
MMRAAIFDFDGTLTPLTLDFSLLRAKVEEMAREYVDESVLASQADQYILEMIHGVADALAEEGPRFRQRAFQELRLLEVESARGKSLYPYAKGTLLRLRSKGVKVGIITRTCIEVIETVFPDLAGHVDTVVTRDDTRYVKPNPEHVRLALEVLQVAPREAVLVGDHPTDIEAGRALGTLTAGVLTGRTSRAQFVNAGADHIFDDIRGVVGLLEGDR